MASVLVIVEVINGQIKKSAMEAVSYGHALAAMSSDQCIALAIGEHNEISSLGSFGASKVLHVNKNISMADNQSWTKFIGELAIKTNATCIIMAHNSTSKSIAGRLAIRLQSGLGSAISRLPDSIDNFQLKRSVYAGKAEARISIEGTCKIITLAAGSSPIKSDGGLAAVEVLNYQEIGKIKVIEVKRISGKIPLPEAEIVVSAGRGLKDPSNWGIVEELAETLGATTACSRPVADAGWRPHHEHVGQTGIAIKPKLYIALGISGAIQHLAGVNNSKVIVVVNKDPEAPFFKAADYGIVGDVFEVVPKLTAAIKRLKMER